MDKRLALFSSLGQSKDETTTVAPTPKESRRKQIFRQLSGTSIAGGSDEESKFSTPARRPCSAESEVASSPSVSDRKGIFRRLSFGSLSSQSPGSRVSLSPAVNSTASASPASADAVASAQTPGPVKGVSLTRALIDEVAARHQWELQESGPAEKRGLKKRPHYNNSRRAAKAASGRLLSGKKGWSRDDKARVGSLIRAEQCQCSRGTCFSQMTAAETEVSELVLHFLGQPKVVRDEVLLQVAAPGLLSVIGFKLARTCFRCLFRIGCKARLAANARGKLHPDMRLRGRTLPRSKCKTSKCYLFLSTLYLRVAETLPHKFHGKWLRRKYKWHRRRMQGMQGSDSESSEEDAPPADALGQAREDIVAEVQHFTRYLTSGLGSDVSHLPLRYLPPGNVHELWLQFCSEHGETTASYATFHKAYKDVSHVLKFRAKGEFSECDECEILKKAIKEVSRQQLAGLCFIFLLHAARNHKPDTFRTRGPKA